MTLAAETAHETPLNDPRLARAERRVQILQELAEIGLSLARDLQRRVLAAPEGPPAQAEEPREPAGLALGRISRAVRLTLALQARFDEDRRALDDKVQALAADKAAALARANGLAAAQRTIRRAEVSIKVEHAIETEADERDVERLFDEFHERLIEASDEEDFVTRPLGEVIAAIRADLGLPVDPALLDDPDWIETGGSWDGLLPEPYASGGGGFGAPAPMWAPKPPAGRLRARRRSG